MWREQWVGGTQQWRGAGSPRAFVTLPRMRTVTFTSPTTYQTTLILHNTSNRHPPLSAFFFIPPNKALYLSLHFVVHFYISMIVHMKYPSFVASSHEVEVQMPLNVTLGETYWGVWRYARSWSLLFWDVIHRMLTGYYRRFGRTYRSYLLKVGPTRCP